MANNRLHYKIIIIPAVFVAIGETADTCYDVRLCISVVCFNNTG